MRARVAETAGARPVWLAVMFAQWAWLSPWLASLSPVFAGSAGTPMMG